MNERVKSSYSGLVYSKLMVRWEEERGEGKGGRSGGGQQRGGTQVVLLRLVVLIHSNAREA